jgi:hypothetical protein
VNTGKKYFYMSATRQRILRTCAKRC